MPLLASTTSDCTCNSCGSKMMVVWPSGAARKRGRERQHGIHVAVAIRGNGPDIRRRGRGNRLERGRQAERAVTADGYALGRAFFEFIKLRLLPGPRSFCKSPRGGKHDYEEDKGLTHIHRGWLQSNTSVGLRAGTQQTTALLADVQPLLEANSSRSKKQQAGYDLLLVMAACSSTSP